MNKKFMHMILIGTHIKTTMWRYHRGHTITLLSPWCPKLKGVRRTNLWSLIVTQIHLNLKGHLGLPQAKQYSFYLFPYYLVEKKDLFILHDQYEGSWCTGDASATFSHIMIAEKLGNIKHVPN